MDTFILLGAGFLGASFLASQSGGPVSLFWKFLLGGGSGVVAWFALAGLNQLPSEASLGGFIMLVAIGGLAGGLAMWLFMLARNSR